VGVADVQARGTEVVIRRLQPARARGPRPHGSAKGGWTLLELVISTVILLIVLLGFSYGLVSTTSLERAVREQGLAREALRGQIELLRATTFEDVLQRFEGASFDVPGLAARPDDADGHVGTVVFPISEDGELLEDLDLPALGMPRDLTGEGDVDDLDHHADYHILPVLVRIEWRGSAGDSVLEMSTMLKRMRPRSGSPEAARD